MKNLLSTPARSRRRRCRGSETAAGMLRWQVAFVPFTGSDGKAVILIDQIKERFFFFDDCKAGDSTDAESAEPEGSNWSRAGRTQVKQSRKNASEAEAEDRKWSRTGGQGNGISDL